VTPFIKICCMASVDEAEMAMRAGASAIGLVSAMPSGAGVIDDATIAEITAAVPRRLQTFLLTSRTDPDAIAAQVHRAGTNTVQVVDRLGAGSLERLRDLIPQAKIVQVVHVLGPESVREAENLAHLVDAILLDSGNPSLAVKELGGTGRTHDWSVSRAIVEAVPVPVYLAGGLHAENVKAAVMAVRPAGVDVCTGVRTSGQLDSEKLDAFFGAVHSVWLTPRD
jgi:phosphoribosylanthranilate isomerase